MLVPPAGRAMGRFSGGRNDQVARNCCIRLTFAVSAHAMTPAPIAQPDSMITEVAAACGAGRTRINGVCVARTTVRHTRRRVRWHGGACVACPLAAMSLYFE